MIKNQFLYICIFAKGILKIIIFRFDHLHEIYFLMPSLRCTPHKLKQSGGHVECKSINIIMVFHKFLKNIILYSLNRNHPNLLINKKIFNYTF